MKVKLRGNFFYNGFLYEKTPMNEGVLDIPASAKRFLPKTAKILDAGAGINEVQEAEDRAAEAKRVLKETEETLRSIDPSRAAAAAFAELADTPKVDEAKIRAEAEAKVRAELAAEFAAAVKKQVAEALEVERLKQPVEDAGLEELDEAQAEADKAPRDDVGLDELDEAQAEADKAPPAEVAAAPVGRRRKVAA